MSAYLLGDLAFLTGEDASHVWKSSEVTEFLLLRGMTPPLLPPGPPSLLMLLEEPQSSDAVDSLRDAVGPRRRRSAGSARVSSQRSTAPEFADSHRSTASSSSGGGAAPSLSATDSCSMALASSATEVLSADEHSFAPIKFLPQLR